jgi:hypothetical protein
MLRIVEYECRITLRLSNLQNCGGPAAYSATEGDDVCIRARHFPFEIDERARSLRIYGHAVVSESSSLVERAEGGGGGVV